VSNVRHTAAFIAGLPYVLKDLHGSSPMTFSEKANMSTHIRLLAQGEIISNYNAIVKKTTNLPVGASRIVSNAMGVLQVNRAAPKRDPDCTFWFYLNRWNQVGHATITASTEAGSFSASNTQKQQRSKVWRSTSNTSQWIRADLGNAYRMNSIVVVSHNLSSNATLRFRASNSSSFATSLYDSGTIDAWEAAFATTGYASEFADSEGVPTQDTIDLLTYCGENPKVCRWEVFEEVTARYVRIDVDDPGNTDAFVEIAYVYAGLCLRVQPDQLYGWQIWPNTIVRKHRAADGGFWIDNLYRHMRATANYGAQPEVNTTAFWHFLSSYVGKTKEFIVAFQPDNLPKKFWYTMYAKFVNPPEPEKIAFKRHRVQMEVLELP